MKPLLILAAFIAGCATIGSAAAQVYPSRPVTMVVPFPAGGSSDAIGGILADGMRAPLGQSIVIENVGGAPAISASAGSRGRRPTATRSSSAAGPRMC
jgi:tripartite-type tricarboxylate transporter receptor subunit TctC